MKNFFKHLPLCAAMALGVVHQGSAQAPVKTTAQTAMTTEDPNWQKKDGVYAVITTPKGKIVCKLEEKKAPMTTGNFVALAEGKHPMATVRKAQPYFDGLNFHRVEPGFVIQGGDPNGNGSGGPGYQFPNETTPELSHNRAGTLAMANAGPNTNGSQFYITKAATTMLDGGYSVFGYVVLGQSVVDATEVGDKMESVKIVRVGKEAANYDGAKAFSTVMGEAQKKLDAAKKTETAAWDAKVKATYPTAKKTASGLYYIIDKEGTGPLATPGQTVVAHYTGTFWDGKKFDSSKDRGQPFEFAVGKGQVIPGWDEGFALMKVGSTGKLIIPYTLAYGERGMPGAIPPKSDLIFDVEMINVK